MTPRTASLLLLLTFFPSRAASSQDAPIFVTGLGAGVSSLPYPIASGCESEGALRLATGIRGGLRWGAATLVGDATILFPLGGVEDCGLVDPMHESGIHTDEMYAIASESAPSRLGAELRYQAFGLPISVVAGAGWVRPSNIATLSTGIAWPAEDPLGRIFSLQLDWFRLPIDRVTREWVDARPVREIGRERHSAWRRGVSIRLGAEVPL